MKHKPYQKYKDSGIQWIGEIPEGWRIEKLKRFVYFQEGPGLRNWQFSEDGMKVLTVTNITLNGIIWEKNELFISDEEYKTTYKHFSLEKNDIVFASSGASWGKSTIVKEKDLPAILNTSTIRCHALKNSKLNHKYLRLFVDSDIFTESILQLITGSCQPNFGPSHLNQIAIILPPEIQQMAIEKYLNTKNSEINQIIEKDKRLIELLKEKRNALINHAVTKGLDPDVKLKDSEVEWIDKIPQHWLKLKGKHIGKIFNSISVDLEANSDENEQILFLQVDDLNEYNKDNIIFDSKIKFAKNHNKVYSKKMLIFPKRGAAIFTNKVNFVEKPFMCDSNLMAFQIMMGVTEYYRYQIYARRLDDIADVSTIPQINNKHIYPLAFISPPITEQKKIVEYLDKATSQIDGVIKKIGEKIMLVEEYKKSLIHHVVTGKVDVRGVEA